MTELPLHLVPKEWGHCSLFVGHRHPSTGVPSPTGSERKARVGAIEKIDGVEIGKSEKAHGETAGSAPRVLGPPSTLSTRTLTLSLHLY